MSSISEFKTRMKAGGARANLFEVEIFFPAFAGGANETDQGLFQARSTSLPPSTLGVIELPFQGRVLPLPGDRTFEEWTCTFINDATFELRDAFEKWSNGINGIESNTGITNPDEYMSDIVIHQLDREGNQIKSYKLQDSWPLSVGPIEVSMDNADTIETFDVSIRYINWSSNTSS